MIVRKILLFAPVVHLRGQIMARHIDQDEDRDNARGVQELSLKTGEDNP